MTDGQYQPLSFYNLLFNHEYSQLTIPCSFPISSINAKADQNYNRTRFYAGVIKRSDEIHAAAWF